ncbi:MAG: hypothetical protein GEV03_20295 [Streptosporangiales bacterium]|nr:hypothetical protein [Streptosporangiales bacterium]
MAEFVDWADWPLLEVRTGDLSAHEARTVVAQALRQALDRGEPFAAVVEIPQVPVRRPRMRGTVEHVRLVKELRPGLAERCRGLVVVMPAHALHDNTKTIRAGAKIWGCPTFAVDDLARARAWARDQLSASASVPPRAASRRIHG